MTGCEYQASVEASFAGTLGLVNSAFTSLHAPGPVVASEAQARLRARLPQQRGPWAWWVVWHAAHASVVRL